MEFEEYVKAKGGDVTDEIFDYVDKKKRGGKTGTAFDDYLAKGGSVDDISQKFYDMNLDEIDGEGIDDVRKLKAIIYELNKRRSYAKGGMTQGYNDRDDDSLGMRRGAERTKMQSYKDRRHESSGMEKSMG